MKAGWQTIKLVDVCEFFSDGDWVESKDQSPEGIRLIQTGNVGFGEFKDRSEKARYISSSTFERLRCTEIFAGDCLISRLPDPVGRSCLLPETGEAMITAVDCTIARFDHAIILPSFFNFYAQSTDYLSAVDSETTGTTRKRISRKKLGLVPIPVPALSEQRRIVGILDEAFEGISKAVENAEANLNNARELFESHLNAIFSNPGPDWTEKPVAEIAQHSLGKMLDKNKNKGEPQPYLRNLNVRWFEFDLDDLLEMRFTEDESDKYSVVKGDVVICEGGYPGRAAIWESDDPIFFQKALHRVRFHEPKYNRWFLYYLYIQERLGNLRPYFTGAGIQHFTGKALARFIVPLPPVDDAALFVKKFDELAAETKRLEANYRQKLALLAELKQSLLHKAFSGEL